MLKSDTIIVKSVNHATQIAQSTLGSTCEGLIRVYNRTTEQLSQYTNYWLIHDDSFSPPTQQQSVSWIPMPSTPANITVNPRRAAKATLHPSSFLTTDTERTAINNTDIRHKVVYTRGKPAYERESRVVLKAAPH